MELRQLRYFAEIVGSGGFTSAARRCGVSQPTLSSQISRLERELGVILLKRAGPRVTTTPAGDALFRRASEILRLAEAAVSDTAEAARASGERVAVGVLSTVASSLLPAAIASVRAGAPDVEITIAEGSTHEMAEALLRGELDLAVLLAPVNDQRLLHAPLGTEHLVLVTPDGPDMPAGEQPATEAAVIAFGAVVCDDHDSPPINLLQGAMNAGVRRIIRCPWSRPATTLSLVRAGLGAALLPELTARQDNAGGVRVTIVEDLPTRELVVAWHAEKERTDITRAMQAALAEQARKLLGEPRTPA